MAPPNHLRISQHLKPILRAGTCSFTINESLAEIGSEIGLGSLQPFYSSLIGWATGVRRRDCSWSRIFLQQLQTPHSRRASLSLSFSHGELLFGMFLSSPRNSAMQAALSAGSMPATGKIAVVAPLSEISKHSAIH